MGPVIPTAEGRAVLCDCGANDTCTPEFLLQFAYLGNFYAKRMLGVESPRVALLNIGAEPEKGDKLHQEAYALLAAGGNIKLKSLEGTSKFLLKELKGMFLSSAKTKLAAGLVKGNLAELKKLLDPGEVGGTPFLGGAKPVVKAHGSSDARAIRNAILRAEEYAASGFISDIREHIELMKVGGNGQKMPDVP